MGRLAFLISAHTDAPQLNRLVEALPEESEFFVHIDMKSDIRPFLDEIHDLRVHFISHRVNVVWGSINEVEYQMELLRAALNSGMKFQYFITLSGMDYPLWSKSRISSYFDEQDGKEILCGNDLSWQGDHLKLYREYRPMARRTWKKGSLKSKMRVALRHLLYYTGKRKPLSFKADGKQYKLYKGAAWWAISEGLAKKVLNEWDYNKELKDYFKTSFCPAETFVQTVAFNSEWSSRCILQEGEWKSLQSATPLTYIYYQPVVKILTEEDFETLKESGKMFGRKFISGPSDQLVEIIEYDKQKTE